MGSVRAFKDSIMANTFQHFFQNNLNSKAKIWRLPYYDLS